MIELVGLSKGAIGGLLYRFIYCITDQGTWVGVDERSKDRMQQSVMCHTAVCHTLCMCASPTDKENYFFNGALQHFLNKFRKWYQSVAQAPPVKMWAKSYCTTHTREFAMVSNSTADSARFSFNKWRHWGHWLIMKAAWGRNSIVWFHGSRRIIYALFVRNELNKKRKFAHLSLHITYFLRPLLGGIT